MGGIMLPDGFPEPAQLDYLDERQVMFHMRHLLNLHDLLALGFDEEIFRFRKKLQEIGWGPDKINELYQRAASYTRYENLVAIDPVTGPRGYFHG